jgi:hypothetical protein
MFTLQIKLSLTTRLKTRNKAKSARDSKVDHTQWRKVFSDGEFQSTAIREKVVTGVQTNNNFPKDEVTGVFTDCEGEGVLFQIFINSTKKEVVLTSSNQIGEIEFMTGKQGYFQSTKVASSGEGGVFIAEDSEFCRLIRDETEGRLTFFIHENSFEESGFRTYQFTT